MQTGQVLQRLGFLFSPGVFAGLIGLAVALVWLSLAPAPALRAVRERLDGYLGRSSSGPETAHEREMSQPFGTRVLAPMMRRLLRVLGGIAPKRNVEATETMLVQAGRPGNLSVLDFMGLRLLCLVLLGALYMRFAGATLPFATGLRNSVLVGSLGYFLPLLWLRRRVRSRQREITRALPDALDMLTIGVESGLAFESALLKVGERWDNPLTREFRRAVAEMRVGTARDAALRRMADRAGSADVTTFVSVLIQSSQLGVSISEILHTQAAHMRIVRRQRAEELARQAGIKMVFPLVFLIFPAIFVVILGPALPSLIPFMAILGGTPVP